MDLGHVAQRKGHSGTPEGTEHDRMGVCPVALRLAVNKGSFLFKGALECADRSACMTGMSPGGKPEPIPPGTAFVRLSRGAR